MFYSRIQGKFREIHFASVGRDDPGAPLDNLPCSGAPGRRVLQMRRYFLKMISLLGIGENFSRGKGDKRTLLW